LKRQQRDTELSAAAAAAAASKQAAAAAAAAAARAPKIAHISACRKLHVLKASLMEIL
jgi:hypothetical protein